jgi:hypothetical protein
MFHVPDFKGIFLLLRYGGNFTVTCNLLISLVHRVEKNLGASGSKRYKRSMANELERFALMSEQEMRSARAQARSTITRVFAQLPDGISGEEFSSALNHYFYHSFWCGYGNAIKHREILDSPYRDPRGRRTLRDAIANELRRDPEKPTLEICKNLDKLRLSARFTYRGKGLLVGKKFASGAHWNDLYDEPCIKMVISRLRRRARVEATARRWALSGEKVFGGKVQVLR